MTDDDVTAINRLGVTVPYGRSIAPFIGVESEQPYCGLCRTRIPLYMSCPACGQMHHWDWVQERAAVIRGHCPPASDADVELLNKFPWKSVPTTSLVNWARTMMKRELRSVNEKEERSVGLAPHYRASVALLRQMAAEELDRRSRRGIEDE